MGLYQTRLMIAEGYVHVKNFKHNGQIYVLFERDLFTEVKLDDTQR